MMMIQYSIYQLLYSLYTLSFIMLSLLIGWLFYFQLPETYHNHEYRVRICFCCKLLAEMFVNSLHSGNSSRQFLYIYIYIIYIYIYIYSFLIKIKQFQAIICYNTTYMLLYTINYINYINSINFYQCYFYILYQAIYSRRWGYLPQEISIYTTHLLCTYPNLFPYIQRLWVGMLTS